MAKRVIVRADDLGFSEGTNHGIAKTVREGIVRTVGLMPNMEAARHGFGLIADEGVCLGQHTNICVGRPLCDPADIPSITRDDGTFKTSAEYRSADHDFVVLDEVVLEIEAQYRRFVEITGREPSYFEGHAVASDNFFRGLQVVAERHGLDYLAFSLGGAPVGFRGSDVYFLMESMSPGYDPLASLERCIDGAHDGAVDVFVCHPGYLDAHILRSSSLTTPRALEVEMCCSAEARELLEGGNVCPITFDDVRQIA